jgi:hypothetical protein
MDRDTADWTVKRLAKRAGISEQISPQRLGHSFITAALDAGVRLRHVQEAASPTDHDALRPGPQSLNRRVTYIVARASRSALPARRAAPSPRPPGTAGPVRVAPEDGDERSVRPIPRLGAPGRIGERRTE